MSIETPEYLLWLDFETTGLDTARCAVLEVAVVLTTETLEEIDRYGDLVYAPIGRVDMADDVRAMHTTSGLLDAYDLEYTVDVEYAERRIIDILAVASVTTCTLAGSGIGTFDLPIIKRLMPNLAARLTYHVHDVGVMRRAYRRATGHDLTPRTEPAHRAMADVLQSLIEGRAFADLLADGERDSEVNRLRAELADWKFLAKTNAARATHDPDGTVRRYSAPLLAEARRIAVAAWAEGHQHPWRRETSDCHCGAWSSSECGCGKYGTGELLSLADNPYAMPANAASEPSSAPVALGDDARVEDAPRGEWSTPLSESPPRLAKRPHR